MGGASFNFNEGISFEKIDIHKEKFRIRTSEKVEYFAEWCGGNIRLYLFNRLSVSFSESSQVPGEGFRYLSLAQ